MSTFELIESQASLGVKALYEDSLSFNMISGQINELTDQGFKDQLKLIQEEVKELEESLDNYDKVEQLDACLDILVTTFGYMQRLVRLYGCDVFDASLLVGENNLSKFPTSEEIAVKSVQNYTQKNLQTEYTYNKDYDVFVIRDSLTGKVKKPVGYSSVNLAGCFPKVQ